MLVVSMLFINTIAMDVAEAKGFSSASRGVSAAPSAARSSSAAPSSARSSSSSSGRVSSSSSSKPSPKSTVTKTSPSGAKYNVPKSIAKSKSNPYSKTSKNFSYRGKAYAQNHYNLSNFWLWAFIFHPTGSTYDDCDAEDLRNGDAECEYAYEYGGETNQGAGGWLLTIGGVLVLVVGALGLFTYFNNRRY